MPVLVLSASDLRELLTQDECRSAMREALSALALGQVHQPAQRPVLAPEGAAGLLGLMPAYTEEDEPIYSLKAVCLFPGNTALGLDSHQGAVLLFSGRTGEALALLNASVLTELRSPAVTAVATELLAREDSSELTIFGAGVQGRAHARALSAIRPFRRIRIVARNQDRLRRVCTELEMELGLPVEPCASARAAVSSSDVLVTATTSLEPVLESSWIQPGTHINAIGSAIPNSREIDSATMAACSLFVDSREALPVETGDFLVAESEGAIGRGHIRASIGEILIGHAASRTSESEITLFNSVGLAVEDLYAARRALTLAEQHGSGVRVTF
ncbi:ornithine cyclodeaminase family protein [Streptomyces sp. NPDC087908]|uniref:ornithine cyclodeaminase family protein n=1 Tax=Streptomyces sp. NPDC087908 TaxID=3365820 RepID=UPI00381F071A